MKKVWTFPPTLLFLTVSQLPVVRSEHVRTLFDSIQSQKSKSEVSTQEFYAAIRTKTHLDNEPYLSSLKSDLCMREDLSSQKRRLVIPSLFHPLDLEKSLF